ncbi:DUF2155 domain-containing protein [Amaricoccus sp.]|uniref:DUF2155 domain-containing protein n=1 Tax=Amaricoccus sp. TaxID=1872485 RepID=UPI001B793FF8|nr:DUF2155 domain-containing protein [Amaricoccus sp.]MBP7243175.1 DUF2155 domain-containing protein [Amaricoccus sp.]
MRSAIGPALAFALVAAQAVAAQSAGPTANSPAVTGGQIANSQDTVPVRQVTLRALDRLNGRTQDITMGVGETVRFGQLEILFEACRVPREAPESDAYAFLRIRDVRDAEPRFSGWMFASSPALSALDHPRYDVWVLDCAGA